MTPGLDRPEALILLLIFPMVFFSQRLKRRGRPMVLTLFPLVEKHISIQRPVHRIHLKQKLRKAVTMTALISLILASSGIYLILSEKPPEEWLIVYDNIYPLLSIDGSRSVKEQLNDFLKAGLDGNRSVDSLAVLTLAPVPTLIADLDVKTAIDIFRDTGLSTRIPSFGTSLVHIEELIRDRGRLTTLILSSRADRWREAVEKAGLENRIKVPEVSRTLTGNMGLVAFDLRPSPEISGRYELFFRVLGPGKDGIRTDVTLRSREKTITKIPLTLDADGSAAVLITDLQIPDGPVILEIEKEDYFPSDDRITAWIQSPGTTIIRALNPLDPFIEKAITSHSAFSMMHTNGQVQADIDIVRGSVPSPTLPRPTLLIDPREALPGFKYLGIRENPGKASFNPTHPITRSATFRNFRPSRLFEFVPPVGFEVLARAGKVPLIMSGLVDGQRMIVWSFDPRDGGIVLDPSFVILLRSSIEWLADRQPVIWNRWKECGPDGLSTRTADIHMAETVNLLCPPVTREASITDIPGAFEFKPVSWVDSTKVRKDMTIPFVFFAALLLFVLLILEAFTWIITEP